MMVMCPPVAAQQTGAPSFPDWMVNPRPSTSSFLVGTGLGDSKLAAFASAIQRLAQEVESVTRDSLPGSSTRFRRTSSDLNIRGLLIQLRTVTGQRPDDTGAKDLLQYRSQLRIATQDLSTLLDYSRSTARYDSEDVADPDRLSLVGSLNDLLGPLRKVKAQFRMEERDDRYFMEIVIPRVAVTSATLSAAK